MPKVNWYLGASDTLANFVTSTAVLGYDGSAFSLAGTLNHLLAFWSTGTLAHPNYYASSRATSFAFINNSVQVVRVDATIDTYLFYHRLVDFGTQNAIDYLFGTLLGSGGNAYQGTTGTQVFEAFRNGDGFIGEAGNDIFQLGRITSITEIGYIHGNDTLGSADSDTDTIQFVGAFNGTIHKISNIDKLVFDAAATVTFEFDDGSVYPTHSPFDSALTVTGNVAGGAITLQQTHFDATNWTISGWTFDGLHTVDLTVNTNSGANFGDTIVLAAAVGTHLGDVVIHTYTGDDYIQGVEGAFGEHTTIDAGAGNDTLRVDATGLLTSISLDVSNPTPNWAALGFDSVIGVEAIYLESGIGNDTLTGGDLSDTLYGNGGDDFLSGGKSRDVLYGGTGTDTIHGGDGTDFIVGLEDSDLLYGENDADTIFGYAGNDTIYGGEGDDYLGGGTGVDSIDGGNGTDRMIFEGDLIGSGGAIASLQATGIDTTVSGVPADVDADGVAALLLAAGSVASLTLAVGEAIDGLTRDHYSSIEWLAGTLQRLPDRQ